MNPISVLVSEADHYKIIQIKPKLEALQELVGGLVEAVNDPTEQNGWSLYCNEEGKLQSLPINPTSTRLVDELFVAGGMRPFSATDVLVGSIVWCGGINHAQGSDTSVSPALVRHFAEVTERRARLRAIGETRLTVIHHGNDIWVYDSPRAADMVESRVMLAQMSETHGTVEVWPGLDVEAWINLRVEIMDDFTITLHDERKDRSYG